MGEHVLGNLRHDSLHDILQSELLRDIRRSLGQDQPHENCTSCHGMTHAGTGQRYNFIRDMYNQRFMHTPVDYTRDDTFVLGGIDLHWDNICNLRCVSCWPLQSSAIAKELRIQVPKPTADIIHQVIDWIVLNQHSLREIYFSGGEPMLIPYNLELLRRLEPRSDLLLRVNSNFTFSPTNPVFQALGQWPNVLYTASVDGMQQRFEYIRTGARWTTVIQNLERCRDQGAQMRVNTVFSVLTATTLLDTQHWLADQYGIRDFTINYCGMDQLHLRCRNLPNSAKQQVRQRIEQEIAVTSDRNLAGQLVNCVRELDTDPDGNDYATWLDAIDARHGSDWRMTFPELVSHA